MKKEKKHSTKDLTVGTRVFLSNIGMILVPLAVIIIAAPFLSDFIADIFSLSSVTSNTYSAVNQIQWSYTLTELSTALTDSKTDTERKYEFEKITNPLEKIGTLVLVTDENGIFYSSIDNPAQIETAAKKISKSECSENLIYEGENGLVIVSNINSHDNHYKLIAVNDEYSLSNASIAIDRNDISSYLAGKTGSIIMIVFGIFAASILILTFVTSKSITAPIKKLRDAAGEIAEGNFDVSIEYDSKNEIGDAVRSFNDMQQRLYQSIENQQRMERSRKEMIAGVAHDLRTPLTSVKGYLEGIFDGIANTPEKQQKYLHTIYNSTCDMEKMLDELMIISKLDLGNIELEAQETDLKRYLEICAEELRQTAEQSGASFEFDPEKIKENILVYLDVDKFMRVLRNIVSNSIKYKKPTEQCKIVMDTAVFDKSVMIEISDNGIGIDAENIVHIFDTFYRVDPARSRVREGSGLGLSVCKQIVELHGGTIWATSQPGTGTIMHISLPREIGVEQ